MDPALIWRLFREEGVTHYNGSPTVQTTLVNHPDAGRLDRRVTAMVAAAPPSPALLARLEELNIRVVHVYGLTVLRTRLRIRLRHRERLARHPAPIGGDDDHARVHRGLADQVPFLL